MVKKEKVQKDKKSIFKKMKSLIAKEHSEKKETLTTSLEKEIKTEYLSKEHLELDIPIVPEAPKKIETKNINSSKLSTDVLERIKKVESPDIKVVLVNCERCKDIIPVPVPKKAVLDSELPVVPISYVHKNLQKKDQHCLTIHLDHDFDVRRQRISDVVVSSD
ncbi:MAG: hypothetical protein JSV23_04440 [Promethearchaeota archaeon]|nr:MAG: hypothetical protein JSV23_04440 [Candidatus Lokiarchaeota archaeon]